MAGDDPQQNGQWIRIADFTPGIHEDFFAASGGGSTLVRNGAATRTNTYRVHADPNSGALTPLPRAVAGSTDSPVGTLTTSYYPAASGVGMFVLDATVVGPVATSVEYEGFGSPASLDAPMVMWGFTYNTAGTGSSAPRYYVLGREYRLASSSKFDFAFIRAALTHSVAHVIPLPPGGIERGWTGAGSSEYPTMALLHAVVSPVNGAIAAAEQAITTYDTDVSANYLTGEAGVGAIASFTRGLAGSGATSVRPNTGHLLVLHQGRFITLGSDLRWLGSTWDSGTTRQTYDIINYSDVRRWDLTAPYTSSMFMEENQSGFGAVASITADQLLVIKNYGGGYIIRGSLTNPTVMRLPFLQSTEGVKTRPALTPFGAVYGTRSGIFSYQGGDSSVHLSPQLAGEFWRSDTSIRYEGIESRFEWWAPYVAVGNNWIMDSRTQAWWRLDIPSAHNNRPFSHYSVSPTSGTLYAFHYKLDGASRAVWQTFSRDTLAQSWSWQSQPLIETQSDMHEFQEVELVAMRPANATGTCTVTVTLTGIGHDGATLASRAVTFDLATCTADRPAVLRKLIGGDGAFTARYVQVRIEASSSSGHAPKVFPGVGMWARRARSMPKV